MSWIKIPNEIIKDFRGVPVKTTKLDKDSEVVYKPIRCPECAFKDTNFQKVQDHAADKHEEIDPGDMLFNLRPVLVDMNTARQISVILARLNDRAKDNPLIAIRKTNDSLHATEVWRRIYTLVDSESLSSSEEEILLKKEQYDWLHQLLDRKLPRKKDKDIEGDITQQTVQMHLFGLSEDGIRQSLTTVPDRRPEEKTPDNVTDIKGAAAG